MRRLAVVILFFAPMALAAPVDVAPGVYLLRGDYVPGRQPDGNSVIFDAPDGLIVVDTGRHVAHTRAILDFAASRKKPIRAVINTHWHLDHIGGNVLIRREVPNVRVYASPALDDALKGFLANYAKQLQGAIAKATEGSEEQLRYRTELGLIESGKQLAPDEVISSSGKRTIAGRPLLLNVETHAVTAGDIWIIDPASGTLVAGDLVTFPFPFLDTACPQRWKESLDRLAKTQFKSLIPGHGPVMTRADLERYRSAYDRLLSCAASEKSNADCANGWLGDVGTFIAENQHELVRGALDYYLDNHLRPKVDNAKRCGA